MCNEATRRWIQAPDKYMCTYVRTRFSFGWKQIIKWFRGRQLSVFHQASRSARPLLFSLWPWFNHWLHLWMMIEMGIETAPCSHAALPATPLAYRDQFIGSAKCIFSLTQGLIIASTYAGISHPLPNSNGGLRPLKLGHGWINTVWSCRPTRFLKKRRELI